MANEIDQLVDVITQRVKEHLTSRPDSCGTTESCRSDESGPCGVALPPMRNPSINPRIGELKPQDMARYIDHTLLKANSGRDEIETLCREARKYGFFSVCVNSAMVHLASSLLYNSPVKIAAVVGFPLGASTPGAKAFEAREAIRCGADEIDMVMNIGAMKSRDYAIIVDDITRVVKAVQPRIVKVILETGMITREELIIACALSKVAGAHFVKTSTGFGPGGAKVDDIALMRQIVGEEMGVKASGGVGSFRIAKQMIEAGATRIGASGSIAIVTGGQSRGGY